MRVSVLVRFIVTMVIGGACWVPAAMSGAADNTGLEQQFVPSCEPMPRRICPPCPS